jgi:hypothetical protein
MRCLWTCGHVDVAFLMHAGADSSGPQSSGGLLQGSSIPSVMRLAVGIRQFSTATQSHVTDVWQYWPLNWDVQLHT